MARVYYADQVIHGFRIVSVENSAEPAGRSVRMIHERTGADLFWLDNDAENMVFSISFRTLPEDSTGVFHILEHSVLCGSRKYPVREPFLELLKSSMNTFLNAMTFPDMTMFPVSSRNFRDLMNLTRVYLDAVFHPIVISDRKRFCQEGWHINRNDRGEPEFRGVVYSEMKGALDDTDTLMDRQIIRQLFPDTCYGVESGGDPDVIPELTYEQFLDFHRRYYHPSNSYIYLYGNADMAERLTFLDEAYLGEYDAITIDSKITAQKAFSEPVSRTFPYSVTEEEPLNDKTHLSYSSVIGTSLDRNLYIAFQIIEYALSSK